MWEDYGVAKEAWEEVIATATLDGMDRDTPPISGAAGSMRRLKWEGHRIHIVTARGFMEHGDRIRTWTKEWLEEFAIPYDTLTFTKDKVAAQEALGVCFDHALDDGWHNYVALEGAGVTTWLVDAPHNRKNGTPMRVPSLEAWTVQYLSTNGEAA